MNDKTRVSQTPVSGPSYVAQYLAEHPDFFLHHREILTLMSVPHDAGVPSLVERQVKALRDKNRELQGQMIEMLKNARDNEQLLAEVMQVTLKLLHADNRQQLAEILRHELHQRFQTDAEVMIVCGNGEGVPPLRFEPHATLLENVHCGFPDAAPVCGSMDANVRRYLFGDLKSDLHSVALLPLGQLAKHGLLAIASRDNDRFSPKMGTLFLEMLAQVASEMVVKLK